MASEEGRRVLLVGFTSRAQPVPREWVLADGECPLESVSQRAVCLGKICARSCSIIALEITEIERFDDGLPVLSHTNLSTALRIRSSALAR